MRDDASRRRAAVADIVEGATAAIVDRVTREASNAGGGQLATDFAHRYGEGIRATLPAAFDALREGDPALQATKLDAVAADIRAVSTAYHVPVIVERGLMSIAFRVALEILRRRAPGSGFDAKELEPELRWYHEELESRLY